MHWIFWIGLSLTLSAHSVQNSKVALHTLLSRHERSFIFGTPTKVPNYEVVFLPSPSSASHSRSKRQLRPSERQNSSCSSVNLTLAAFGQTFDLELTPNLDLLTDRLLVVTREDNATYIWPGLKHSQESCYYHGNVVDKAEGGGVALAYTQGYTGIITTTTEHFIVQPAPKRLHARDTTDTSQIMHIIYKRAGFQEEACGQKNDSLPSTAPPNGHKTPRAISQTPTSKFSIETAVFADKELYALMKENFPADPDRGTVDVVLTMMNAAQLLFQDPSLGIDMDIALVRLEIQKSEFKGLKRSANIDQYLNSFCAWQNNVNPVNDGDPLHWDHALLLTGTNVYSEDSKGVRNSQVVGLAPVSGMCLQGNSCTVNEGGNFESVYVVAHEMGHSMGMQHDGPQNNNRCNKDRYIMSPTLGSGKTTWSDCSKNYLLKFVSLPQSRCLWDPGTPPDDLNHVRNRLLPGQRFNADQQCRLRFGDRSSRATAQPLKDICQDLQCVNRQYAVSSHPALEGTQCGENMYCRSGKCITITRSSSNKAVDGGWSEWSAYTPCVSSCLYGNDGALHTGSSGTTASYRRCDQPHPENGGKNCAGKDRKYQLCNSTDISLICHSVPKITINDFANHICTGAAYLDPTLLNVGIQQPDTDPVKACEVYCEQRAGGFLTKGWQFPDGTTCRLIGTHGTTYCINGRCTEFACNGKTLDETNAAACNSVSGYMTQTAPAVVETWEPTSSCMFGCVDGGQGLRSVKSKCSTSSNSCQENRVRLQLCTDYRRCLITQTTSSYSLQVCQALKKSYPQLSGHGTQLEAQPNDPNLPCFVSCQDATITSKYYKIDNIESGMFPVGTQCSSGNLLAGQHFCLIGQCVVFGTNGISTSATVQLSHVFRRSVPSQYEDDSQHDLNILENRWHNFHDDLPKLVDDVDVMWSSSRNPPQRDSSHPEVVSFRVALAQSSSTTPSTQAKDTSLIETDDHNGL